MIDLTSKAVFYIIFRTARGHIVTGKEFCCQGGMSLDRFLKWTRIYVASIGLKMIDLNLDDQKTNFTVTRPFKDEITAYLL